MRYHILMADALSSHKRNPTAFIGELQGVVKEANKKRKHDYFLIGNWSTILFAVLYYHVILTIS
jgi:hypothetical protein